MSTFLESQGIAANAGYDPSHVTDAPDLVVYLQSSVDRLMTNIRKRAGSYETNMSEEYIRDLNEA